MVNAIPECATIESYVRGLTYDAMIDANRQINQALIGAALSIGANVEIIDMPGYAPRITDMELMTLAKDAFLDLFPDEQIVIKPNYSSGSSDMGDLSCIMPTIHPYAPGAAGTSHGADYYIVDPDRACVQNAAWQVGILRMLLENGAKEAKRIIDDFKPRFTKDTFLEKQMSIFSSGERIEYTEGGANVKL